MRHVIPPVSHEEAMKRKSEHVQRPGGFVHVGKLPMPTKPVYKARTCEPSAVSADGSVHFLLPPKGADPMRMIWHLSSREWAAAANSTRGRRLAFESAYLAAHGWKYMGAAP